MRVRVCARLSAVYADQVHGRSLSTYVAQNGNCVGVWSGGWPDLRPCKCNTERRRERERAARRGRGGVKKESAFSTHHHCSPSPFRFPSHPLNKPSLPLPFLLTQIPSLLLLLRNLNYLLLHRHRSPPPPPRRGRDLSPPLRVKGRTSAGSWVTSSLPLPLSCFYPRCYLETTYSISPQR
jgi:hypothetical protein